MKKIAFMLGIVLMHFFSIAQEHVFNVIASSGNAKLSTGTILKSGDKISSDQTIIIGTGAYVALMHKTGKTVELQKVGSFAVTNLAQNINKGAETYASQYSGFVVDQMAGAAGLANSYSNTGSVKRDIKPVDNIEVLLPSKISLLKNTPFHFSWVGPQKRDTYTVKIFDLFNNVLYKKTLSSSELELDLSNVENLIAGENKVYLLQIYSVQNQKLKSKRVQLFVKTSIEEQKISSEYTNLTSELGSSNAVNSLIIASFYDKKGLTAYAADNLEQATQQAPKVDHYQKVYVNYLNKNKVNTKYVSFPDK